MRISNLFILLLLTLLLNCGGEAEFSPIPGVNEEVAIVPPTETSQSDGEGDVHSDLSSFVVDQVEVKCESQQFKKAVCNLPKGVKGFILDGDLKLQLSQSACLKDKTYKIRAHGRRIVVKKGCRGIFSLNVITNMKRKVLSSKKNWKGTQAIPFSMGEFDSESNIGQVIDMENSTGVLTKHADGTGVAGGSPVSYQINHDPVSLQTEALGLELPENTVEVKFLVTRLFPEEHNTGERAGYVFLDAQKVIVAKGILDKTTLKYRKGHEGRIKIHTHAKYVVFYGLPFLTLHPQLKDSSDFLVKKVIVRYLE